MIGFIIFVIVVVSVVPIILLVAVIMLSSNSGKQLTLLQYIQQDQKKILDVLIPKTIDEPIETIKHINTEDITEEIIKKPKEETTESTSIPEKNTFLQPLPVITETNSECSIKNEENIVSDHAIIEKASEKENIQANISSIECKDKELSTQTITSNNMGLSQFELKAQEILSKIWSWIIVGEEFRMKNVAIEYAIATTWLVRIGVIVTLCGGAFFLKYSIDHGLLSPPCRIALSLLVAIGVLILGMIITGNNKKYDLIGRGLLGGSIALLYFSFYSAAVIYQLINLNFAFVLMILVTITAWIISLRKDSLLIAILGLIGGIFTPILLNSGGKNLPVLFSYILILAIGALAISRYRNWKLLNILSFLFTWSIYIIALDRNYNSTSDYPIAITFLCLYFVVFFGQTIIFNIRKRESISIIELGMILLDTFLLFLIGWSLTFRLYPRVYGAFFSLGAGAFFTFFIVYFIHRNYKDRNLLLALFAIAVFSITVTFPLLFSGSCLTFAWSALAVLLLWLSLRIGSSFLLNCSFFVYILSFIHIIFIDRSLYIRTHDYFTGMIHRLLSLGAFILALAIGKYLMEKYKNTAFKKIISSENDTTFGLTQNGISTIILWSGAILLVGYLTLEAIRFSGAFYLPLREPTITLIWVIALAILAYYAHKLNSIYLEILTLFVFSVLIIKLLIDLVTWRFDAIVWAYTCIPIEGYFFMRTIEFFALIAIALFCKNKLRKSYPQCPEIFAGTAIGLLFIYLTLEMSTMLLHFLPDFRTGGISVLWGIFAFFLIYQGLHHKNKKLRYSGLALFCIDILKIFLIDLSNLPQIYKIIAFIILGLILLGGAFVYIKFREQFEIKSDKEKNTTKDGGIL